MEIMMDNGIYFFMSKFSKYIKIGGSAHISKWPARCDDNYIYATFFSENNIGFLKSNEGKGVVKKILMNSILINHATNRVSLPCEGVDFFDFDFLVYPKNNNVESAINDYKNYFLSQKKYEILSRHREASAPERHFLADFIENNIMSEFVYDFLINNSYFISRQNHSGLHGHGAYELGFRGRDICQEASIKEIFGQYNCFRVPYCELPIH